MASDKTRCAMIAVVGAPNAGKSTLVNNLTGAKVSIVTPKMQTTRMRVVGVRVTGGAQLVFIDTPGIFAPKKRLERAMVKAAWGGAEDADEVVLVVDAARRISDDTRQIIEGLKAAGRPAILALNKVDIARKDRLLAMAQELNEIGNFTDTFMIAAETGDGVPDLLNALVARAPEGPWLYPEDQLSDLNDRLYAAEVTREQLFLKLYQELPYAIAVETYEWEDFKNGAVRIRQNVLVERDSQRAIVLGKGGEMLKSVGQAARQELERQLGRRVHLFLDVVVKKGWSEERERYASWGLDYEA
jgi:GTP-binding protein Era